MAIDLAALVAHVTEHNRRASFDGRIAELERICRRDLPPGVPVISESRPWYAKEILDTIGVVRHWLAQGQPDVAAAEAVVVGMLAARAGALYDWSEVQRWNKLTSRLGEQSKIAAQLRRENAAPDAEKLRAEVDEMRRKRPGLSANAIAQVLHDRQSDGREEDRKKKIAALAKRITRLESKP